MLKRLYEQCDVPKGDQIPLEKNIVLIIPEEDFDLTPYLTALGVSRYEAAVTWPKRCVDLTAEVCSLSPKLVIQCGGRFSRKFPVIEDVNGENVAGLRAQVWKATADGFVGLHHHDEYSIRDGLGTVTQLVKMLNKQRRSFCCVTNHGSVGGWVKQYKACRESGVKPIFGMEAYVSPYRGDDPEEKKKHRSSNHLVLIARNREGFDNIIRIHNDAQVNGFYYYPRADREAFKKWGKGIVASSACMKGEIPELVSQGKRQEAIDLYHYYAECFDQFFIELQIIEHEDQREVNRQMIQLAQEVGAPLILACDSHYLEPEHSSTHDILMCVRQHRTIVEKIEKDDVWTFDVANLYYRNKKQVEATFYRGFMSKGATAPSAPFLDDVFTEEVFREAVNNTRKIVVETEDIELDSTIKLPVLYDDGKRILREKVNAGIAKRGLNEKKNAHEYRERARYEYGVITKLGWTDYFLITERIITDAKKEFGDWTVGFGRGSGAGSLVCYCLGITDVDPLEHGLLFERFISEDRVDPPDIDNDIDPRYREAVKKHIVEVFGEENVCSIGSYQTYKTRAVVIDVARTLGYNVHEVMAVTKKIDPLQAIEDEEGEEHKVDDMSFEELCTHFPELSKYFDEHPDVRNHAEVLRNQIKSMGTHAGGVIISDMNLHDGRIPVLYDKPGQASIRKIISGWAEAPGKSEELSAVGLVKFDILGLNNLPVVADCVDLIEKHRGIKLTRDTIPIDDYEAIKMGSKDDLVGIFQLENPATLPVATAVGLESLGDVSALTSLIRPGPRDMGMDMEYAERKKGKEYDMPAFLKKLLAETHGVITYQEQTMVVARELSGFSGGESYKFVKTIAKKIPAKMAAMKSKFVSGAQPRIDAGECTPEDVENIWSLLETFAGYGFNKSHATAYSALSTAQLWLKYNYFIEFMCALINNTKQGKKKHGSTNVIVDYINYVRRRNIVVMSPHLSKSHKQFTIEDGKIRFSLGHIKNVASMAPVIESFQPISSIEDFHERVKNTTISPKTGKESSRRPNKKVVQSLVAAGAFDHWGTRNEVMAEYYRCRGNGKEEPPEYSDDKWRELECEVTGLCLSEEPLFFKVKDIAKDKKWTLISMADREKRVRVIGRIDAVIPHTSKAGNSMYKVTVTDDIDSLMFYVFKTAMEFFRDHFKIGDVAALALDRFDDDDSSNKTRFFNDRGKSEIVDLENL